MENTYVANFPYDICAFLQYNSLLFTNLTIIISKKDTREATPQGTMTPKSLTDRFNYNPKSGYTEKGSRANHLLNVYNEK